MCLPERRWGMARPQGPRPHLPRAHPRTIVPRERPAGPVGLLCLGHRDDSTVLLGGCRRYANGVRNACRCRSVDAIGGSMGRRICSRPSHHVVSKEAGLLPRRVSDIFVGRTKLLYSIHASNLAQHYAKAGLRYWWKWLQFRTRVSLETCKWLTYALIRKRIEIIRESAGGECAWEFFPVRWYRNCLMWGHRMGVI